MESLLAKYLAGTIHDRMMPLFNQFRILRRGKKRDLLGIPDAGFLISALSRP
jgi:hypothetical protein